jgi:cytochrome P450
LQDGIRRIVHRVLAEADDGSPFDFLHRVSLRIPTLVYLMLIDGPDADEEFVSRVSDGALKVFLGKPELKEEIEGAYLELFDYVERMIELRRKNPGQDLISHLIRQVDSDVMTHQEAVDLIALTLEASVDTTANTMTSAVGALLADREAWKLLVSDPETVAIKARDEALRMFPAVLRNRRVASEDLVFEGVEIPAGTTVFAPNLAAGRDSEIYPQPNTFDLQRESPRPFTTFGGGMFACLGQNIARLDVQELLMAMAKNHPNAKLVSRFEPAYDPPMFGLAKPVQVVLS